MERIVLRPNKGEVKLGSFFINMLDKQFRKGKDHVFDFSDPEALKRFRETLRKMFSIMIKARNVNTQNKRLAG